MATKETKIEKNEEEKFVEKNPNKKFLAIECVITFTALAIFLLIVTIASVCELSERLRIVLIVIGFVNLLANCFIALYIESLTGYYVCDKCGYKHKSTYLKIMASPHIGWTRYMRCPKCGQKSWQNKKLD